MGLFGWLKKGSDGSGEVTAWREPFADALCGAAIGRHLMRQPRGAQL